MCHVQNSSMSMIGQLVAGGLDPCKSKVMSGLMSTYDRAHLRSIYSDGPLGNQVTETMSHIALSHFIPTYITMLTTPCPILVMPSTRLGGSAKYQFYKPLILLRISCTQGLRSTDSATTPRQCLCVIYRTSHCLYAMSAYVYYTETVIACTM